MANVEHSTLTGSNLHESKGVAAATASTVYVADGAGSGAWSTIALASLASTAKSFQSQLLHVRDEQTSGTSGPAITNGAWRTRTLNTVVGSNEITSSSLASNQITLPAGTYFIEATVPGLSTNGHQAKLYDVTSAVDLVLGTSEYSSSASGNITRSLIKGRFTLAGTKALELRHRVVTTTGTSGTGSPASTGTNEVYAEALIWKVA